jgi:hypothetical protein
MYQSAMLLVCLSLLAARFVPASQSRLHSAGAWSQTKAAKSATERLQFAAANSPWQAVRTADFVDSVGVNTHVGWLDTTYADIAQVAAHLAYIGVHNIRDGITSRAAIPRLATLGRAGIRANLMLPNGNIANINHNLAEVKLLHFMLRSIEGPNEIDLAPVQYQGLTGYRAAVALQRALYTKVRADPFMANIPVLQFTLGNWGRYIELGTNVSAYADFANIHYYPNRGRPPRYGIWGTANGIDYSRSVQAPLGGDDTLITTETGYPSGGGGALGVDEVAQAKYIPQLLTEQFVHGVNMTYIYQLQDPWTPQDPGNVEHWWGLFRPDGSAKPAATALRNLMSVLQDDDTRFVPGTLDYTLADQPSTIGKLLLQKSSGTYYLALWNAVSAWSHLRRTSIDAPAATVTLEFKSAPSEIVLHDILAGTATPLAASRRMLVAVPGHVVVLEIQATTSKPDTSDGVHALDAPTALACP